MQLSDNARGAVYMMVAMAAFTLNDTAMKALTQDVPLFQAIAMRGVLTLLGLVVLAMALGQWRARLPRRDGVVVGIRCVAEVVSTVLFLAALVHMPLANLSAIMQALPLAVTLAAALVFKEVIGWRRMTAILIGFVGVLIIIRPGPDGFDIWSLMGLGSVVFVLVRDLASRSVSRAVPSVMVAVWASAAVTATATLASLASGWVPLNAGQGGLVAAAAAALVIGYLFSVMVMRVGDISFVAPFRYTALIWAIFLGWLVFGSLPDPLTLIGAALVVATGIFTLWRERKIKARKA
ncbi:MAG: DMT family transporter [Pseudotabrizicola sp.]|uniref:DMT family transporter n=1 Tax=Pseudotabrizicola sp. TaxID=2939647 RepID=UPI00272FDEC7|nr:DMT family transporter [Pseudotabrizicola sp.]MDP2080161.1 DMT family transporter [Pseudotabrizicola sp.]MDZ7574982.1 DMT family transporter [Pseudotabrizicola sp.]